MIFLIIFLLSEVIASAEECYSFIAESEIKKALALEPNAGAKPCGGSDPCICFQGIDWETAEYDARGKKLSENPKKKAAKEARIAAEKKAEADAEKECQEALASLDKPSATNAELKRALKAMRKGCN